MGFAARPAATHPWSWSPLQQLLCDPRRAPYRRWRPTLCGFSLGCVSRVTGSHHVDQLRRLPFFPVAADGLASTGAARHGSETEFYLAHIFLGSSRRQQRWDGSGWASRQADGQSAAGSHRAWAPQRRHGSLYECLPSQDVDIDVFCGCMAWVAAAVRSGIPVRSDASERAAVGGLTPTGAPPLSPVEQALASGHKYKAFRRFEAVLTAICARTPQSGAEEACSCTALAAARSGRPVSSQRLQLPLSAFLRRGRETS